MAQGLKGKVAVVTGRRHRAIAPHVVASAARAGAISSRGRIQSVAPVAIAERGIPGTIAVVAS